MKRSADTLLMDEKAYWDIVAKSLEQATDQGAQLSRLIAILKQQPPDKIIQFSLRTDQLLHKAHTDELLCAATIMNDRFISDDSFIYFKTWLISRGKEVYNAALLSPDSLARQLRPEIQYYEFEVFRYAPSYAFTESTGGDIYEHFPNNFPYYEGRYPKLKYHWVTGDPYDMRKVCPKLYDAKFDPKPELPQSPKESPKIEGKKYHFRMKRRGNN